MAADAASLAEILRDLICDASSVAEGARCRSFQLPFNCYWRFYRAAFIVGTKHSHNDRPSICP
jgi:hypothetical protein